MDAKDQGFNGGLHFWRRSFGQRGWLRPTVLKVLESGPKNGIEIMDGIQEMSHGWWRPSPGSIYPLLEQLSNEKVIKKGKNGRYGLTYVYRGEPGPANGTEEVLTNMDSSISYLEELASTDRKEFASYRKRIAEISRRLSKLGK